ncbi:hypothetical protein B0H10DRAFT_230022 [Mycena sp. CBHHK59/15]|nr:hypothetical protein B0H10DRAFT_230022 [Mycena sp. CBHHK59/15]
MIPLLYATYSLQYSDRTSLVSDMVFELYTDTHLIGQQYAWLSTFINMLAEVDSCRSVAVPRAIVYDSIHTYHARCHNMDGSVGSPCYMPNARLSRFLVSQTGALDWDFFFSRGTCIYHYSRTPLDGRELIPAFRNDDVVSGWS